MNHFTNTLAETLLSKKWEDCSTHELQNLSTQYPYASVLQWLYCQKLFDQNKEGYTRQLQKASLYHHHSLLDQYIIGFQPAVDTLPSTGFEKEQSSTPPSPDIEDQEEILIQTEYETTMTEQSPEPITLPQFFIKAVDTGLPFSFTPYHTIDYFAAQGIKLSEDQKTEGRFDTQLKSFTEWLRQMKRLPGASANTTSISTTEEKNIESLAERSSINNTQIATETMAEVWAKQGNTYQAIDTYKKLCLQFPHKNAYFAAKIDFLKKQI